MRNETCPFFRGGNRHGLREAVRYGDDDILIASYLGDDPKQSEGDERGGEELVAPAQRQDGGPAVGLGGGRDEPETHHVVVHGAAPPPPRAAVGPVLTSPPTLTPSQ